MVTFAICALLLSGQGISPKANLQETPEQKKQAEEATRCLYAVKDIATALIAYSEKHDGWIKLTKKNWREKITPFMKDRKFPTSPQGIEFSINAWILGKCMYNLSESSRTIVIYESRKGEPTFDHRGRCAVAHADTSCSLASPDRLKMMLWKS